MVTPFTTGAVVVVAAETKSGVSTPRAAIIVLRISITIPFLSVCKPGGVERYRSISRVTFLMCFPEEAEHVSMRTAAGLLRSTPRELVFRCGCGLVEDESFPFHDVSPCGRRFTNRPHSLRRNRLAKDATATKKKMRNPGRMSLSRAGSSRP
jgi:hypothetical protein